MNGFDVLIILALVGGAAWGFIKGLIHQAVTVGITYVAIIVATLFYGDVTPLFIRYVKLDAKAAGAVSFLLLMILAINVLAFALRDVRKKEIKALRSVNQLGGMAFGLAIASVWIALIIALLYFGTGVPANWHDPGKPLLATVGTGSFRQMIAVGLVRSPLVRAFRTLLPYILQSVSPFVSTTDVLRIFIIE